MNLQPDVFFMKSLQFDVFKSTIGFVKLEDKTLITIRVVIGFIEEIGYGPTGPDLDIAYSVYLFAFSPQELKTKMIDKPIPPPTGEHLRKKEIWEIIKIIEKKAAAEECIYKASDGKNYKVKLEINPAIAARTLEYRDKKGNPVYNIRWTPSLTIELI